MKIKYLIQMGLMLVLLTGCSSFMEKGTLPKDDPRWQQHLTKLQHIQSYKINGQIGFLAERERVSANFQWNYINKNNFNLKLVAFLNMFNASLTMDSNGLLIEDNKGKKFRNLQAKVHLEQLFKTTIPLNELTQWVKGIPPEDYVVGDDHLLYKFRYEGWEVTYLDYEKYQNIYLPKDILLKNDDTSIKIRIKNWEWTN